MRSSAGTLTPSMPHSFVGSCGTQARAAEYATRAGDRVAGRASRQAGLPHTVGVSRVTRAARPLVLAGIVAAIALVSGAASWRAASAATRVLNRGDVRFDVLVQRRTERLDDAGAEMQPPGGQPRLSAAQAWSIAGARRQPKGRKPSVRLATFVDPDFPGPAGPGRRLVPVAERALVWVVVVPDVPVVDFGPDIGQEDRPARKDACPTYTPVDDRAATRHLASLLIASAGT
jgi:hypothetical protein